MSVAEKRKGQCDISWNADQPNSLCVRGNILLNFRAKILRRTYTKPPGAIGGNALCGATLREFRLLLMGAAHHAVAGKGITSARFVPTGAKLTFCA